MPFKNLISGETRFFTFTDGLLLESGIHLPSVTVAFRTWGHLAPRADNAVLVCHAFTGSADADQWWGALIGPGNCLDPDRDFIICSNILGSCYGSTGPAEANPLTGQVYGPDFPAISVRDMVRLQTKLIDALGVRSLRLVIGGSLGGMQALEWSLCEPDRVQAIASIAASARQSPWCIGLDEAQRAAIRADVDYLDGRFPTERPPLRGLSAARMIGMCSYRAPSSFALKFDRRRNSSGDFEAASYLRHHGQKLVERFDANCYVTLTEAMDGHDLSRNRSELRQVLESIRCPALIVGIDSDQLYRPDEQEFLASHIPSARLAWLNSQHGHDGFLIETTTLDRIVRSFRHQVEDQYEDQGEVHCCAPLAS